jgi:hypothetical protein
MIFFSFLIRQTRRPPRVLESKESDLYFIFIYTCLFDKVLDLEYISISTMCFIMFMRNMKITYKWI